MVSTCLSSDLNIQNPNFEFVIWKFIQRWETPIHFFLSKAHKVKQAVLVLVLVFWNVYLNIFTLGFVTEINVSWGFNEKLP